MTYGLLYSFHSMKRARCSQLFIPSYWLNTETKWLKRSSINCDWCCFLRSLSVRRWLMMTHDRLGKNRKRKKCLVCSDSTFFILSTAEQAHHIKEHCFPRLSDSILETYWEIQEHWSHLRTSMGKNEFLACATISPGHSLTFVFFGP
jgi:hypothetical protein